MLIIIFVVGVVILGAVGGGFYLMWNKLNAGDAAVEAPQPQAAQPAATAAAPSSAVGPIYPLDAFIVNLADEGGKRFLRINLNLEYSPRAGEKDIEKHLPQIKDAVLMLLPTKTQQELASVEGKTTLRKELIDELNKLFGWSIVTNIYFTEFVIQ